MRITHLPVNDKTNGWSLILPHRAPNPALAGSMKADWVVVGAGYAGLAAARRLAENRPDERIIVLEAGEAGENASGRNSGFGIDLPHVVGSGQDDLASAHAYMRLSRAAIDHLEDIVTRHGIACDWSRAGKYHAAVSRRGAEEMLDPFIAMLERVGEPHRVLDAAQTAAELGTSYYHASVSTPGCVLMNPAGLSRGLADSLPGNVTLYENTPVIAYDRDNGVRLTTPSGSVVAPRMIVAVNAFAAQFGYWKGRLLPFEAQASLTRPLDNDEHALIGKVKPWGLTPVNAFVSTTMRLTADRRIMIRYFLRYSPDQRTDPSRLAGIRAAHLKVLRSRFPRLKRLSLEHTWTGYVCLSRNNAPGFGKVDSNVWSAVCQNAVGVTKGTISGLLAADLACGIDNPLIADMDSLGQPSSLPPRPVLDLGVRLRNAWDGWRGAYEY
ncbi:MAG: FAD-binding oxidoreductase [Alphaproteobacteria bacterium]|nr:FAD-binding oxidoreductase [Alphaproteobacteria bacterium]